MKASTESGHPEEALAKLGRMIRDIQFAMLTTIEADGSLRSRPMATHQDHEGEFDGVLWFFTKHDSPKVEELAQDKHVSLSYSSPEQSRYVSISGMGTIVLDKLKAQELWDPKYIAWFPKGLDDPELALLRVDVTRAEYWDTPGSQVVHAIGYIKALATGKPYQPGDHEKISIG